MELSRHILTLLIALTPYTAMARIWSEAEKKLAGDCRKELSARHFSRLASAGHQLEREAQKTGNGEAAELGLAFGLEGEVLSYSSENLQPVYAKVTAAIDSLAKAGVCDERYSRLCLAAATYCSAYDIDFAKAAEYALKALRNARSRDMPDIEIRALSRLAAIYCDKGDSTGMKWAEESTKAATKTHDLSELYMTACNMAAYLFRNQKYNLAATYLDRADSIATAAGMTHEQYYIDSFRGELANKLGNYHEADMFFRKALRPDSCHTPFDRWYANASYACFLHSKGRHDEASGYFRAADRAMTGHRAPGAAPTVYRKMSEALEKSGHYGEALEAYKKYSQLITERDNAKKEKEFKELELKYHLAEQRNLNVSQQMEIAEKRRAVTVAVAMCLIFLAGLIALGVTYHLTLKYYRRIVGVNIAALKREKHLRHELSEIVKRENAHNESRDLRSRERSDDIYLRLNRLMEEEHVYRRPDMTLDQLAAMTGTNRTYLLQAIKHKTGMTYSSYINDLRINDAIELLSSSTSADVVKTVAAAVGFENASYFCRLFKHKVGVSPSVFRQQATGRNDSSPD